MSKECCGVDDGAPSTPARPLLSVRPLDASAQNPEAGGCSCCAEASSPRAARIDPVDAPAEEDCCGRPTDPHATPEAHPWWQDSALRWSVASGALLAIGWVLTWTGANQPMATTAFAIALLCGARTFVPGAVRALLRRRLGVGLLMTIAAVGAVTLGHLSEAAMLAFLFSLAESLEERAMSKARHGLRALLALIPDTARVVRNGTPIEVETAQLRVGDLLIVAAGDRVATDGVVESGRSSLDTAAITGESIPVAVGGGDDVSAGSINGTGVLQVRATSDGDDNSLTTIVRLVEAAQARKGERARLADRIARPLVPLVLAAAALVALFGLVVGEPGTWLERALVVLVAASPCALAISVPVTVISAIGSASRFGMVITSGAAFERLGDVRTVALDKTGTLTRGEPQVVDVVTAPGQERANVLAAAAALEVGSAHPLAAAVVAAAPAPPAASEVAEEPGLGIRGRVEGRDLRVGSPRWVDTGELRDAADALTAQGMSLVVVEADGEAVGVIGVRDELAPGAREAVNDLRAAGLATLMLTGDNARTARALAAQAGIRADDVYADQLPADKAAVVERLSASASGPVAMIGDGVNDTPALAAADVGIAMGASGSAAAVESADVAFTGTDLRLIPRGLAHARRGRRIMTANIGLALAIIVVLFPLALFGVLSLTQVVLVHEIAEVVVIANGIRAARVAREPRPAPAPATRPRPPASTPARDQIPTSS